MQCGAIWAAQCSSGLLKGSVPWLTSAPVAGAAGTDTHTPVASTHVASAPLSGRPPALPCRAVAADMDGAQRQWHPVLLVTKIALPAPAGLWRQQTAAEAMQSERPVRHGGQYCSGCGRHLSLQGRCCCGRRATQPGWLCASRSCGLGGAMLQCRLCDGIRGFVTAIFRRPGQTDMAHPICPPAGTQAGR